MRYKTLTLVSAAACLQLLGSTAIAETDAGAVAPALVDEAMSAELPMRSVNYFAYYASRNPDNRVFVFNPRKRTWAAYINGRKIKSGRASGGANYCRDVRRACRTPSGVYHIFSKGSRHCKSSRYPRRRYGRNGGAKMPYCMFFSRYYAIHGSHDVPRHRNASHGCIRVTTKAARWLSRNFITIGTKVIVKRY